jgi:hypothetical protein
MSLWLKIPLLAVGALAALAMAVYVWGSRLPREHTASRRLVLKTATPDAVWARIADEAAASQWRKHVKAAIRLPDRNGHEVWREDFTSGNALSYETLEKVPPTRFVRQIVDEEMFGGTWTITLAPDGTGTAVIVTEDGWVASPIFRVVAKHVMGHDSTMNAYLRHLAASFGEAAESTSCEGECAQPPTL